MLIINAAHHAVIIRLLPPTLNHPRCFFISYKCNKFPKFEIHLCKVCLLIYMETFHSQNGILYPAQPNILLKIVSLRGVTMKKYLPLIIALSAVSGASYAATSNSENTVSYLQMRHGIAYQVNQTTPFTGKYAEKYDNGQFATKAQFKNGVEYGQETNWFVNGQVASKIHYIKGKIDGKVEAWYPNGAKKAELVYKNGNLNGETTRWYPGGEKRLSAHYVNGKENGLFTHFYPNGKKATQTTYKNGMIKDGKVTLWNPRGEKIEQLTFKHKQLVSEQSWLPKELSDS